MSVQKELKKGLIVTSISKYSNIFFELVISIVLARLLTPEEFGIVAVILVFIVFFNIIGEIGIGAAIIQNKKLTQKHIQSIFNYTIFIGLVTSAIFLLICYPIADFYENDAYIKIGRFLCIVVFFYILNIVPQSLLRKKKDFLKLEGTILAVNLITGLFAIYLAYNGHGYYSLIYREIVKSILLFILNFYTSKFSFGRSMTFEAIKLIFKYSLFQFLFNFINYFSRNLDSILIGKYMGASNLGFYDRAYRLMLYPVQTLTFVITPVLHPVLSQYQNEPDVIYNNYKKILEFLAFLGVPLSVFLYFSAEEIVLIMYGEQWVNSIPVFKILALTIWIQMTLSSTGAIFQALGKTNLLFVSGFISAVFTIAGIYYGVSENDLVKVGYGLLVAYLINLFQVFYLLFVVGFKKHIFHFITFFKVGFVSALLLLIVLFLFSLMEVQNIYLNLIFKMILLLFSFIIGAFFLKKEYLQFVKKTIKTIKTNNNI